MQLNEDVRIARGNRNAHRGRVFAYIQQYWHFVEHNIARPQITVGLEQNVPIEKMIQLQTCTL